MQKTEDIYQNGMPQFVVDGLELMTHNPIETDDGLEGNGTSCDMQGDQRPD